MSTGFKSLAMCALAAGLMACGGPTSDKDHSPEKEIVMDVKAAASWTERSMPEIAGALETGEISSEALVQAYLDRIESLDTSGPELNSIIAINPEALDAARNIDKRRARGDTIGPLQGMPILIKDNIETSDRMPTTAGSLALTENFATSDAPLIARIKAADGIILGKTNLSEWANFRSSNSQSGWSGVGGRTKNPHVLDRQTCGSSAGSGAATAASLAAGSVGTETNGSIICPSQANGIVGFKPSLGLVSQEGIVPIAFSQDTAGPMTRTVEGAALLLTVMSTDGSGKDYRAGLSPGSLNGVRVGVMRFSLNNDPMLTARFEEALGVLESQGAVLVDITVFTPNTSDYWGKALRVLQTEFKATLNDYLASTPESVTTRNLTDLIAFNNENAETELSVFDQSLFVTSDTMPGLDDPAYLAALQDVKQASGDNGIDRLMAEYDVDVLVGPAGPVMPVIVVGGPDNWPQWAGAGHLAAIAGYPNLTVPMGDVGGVPVGLSFIAAYGHDADVLTYGYAYEQASGGRKTPEYKPSTLD